MVASKPGFVGLRVRMVSCARTEGCNTGKKSAGRGGDSTVADGALRLHISRIPGVAGGFLAILVAAVANRLHQIARLCEYRIDARAIFRIEREAEHSRIVGDMLRHPEPRANDYSG